eukprot:SAG22_NODE_53_length_24242_cov_158.884231_13_plen_95_part_00
MGTFDQGLGCCGWYRHGAAREVIVNSPGSDYAGFTSHWLTPRFIYTDLWLGVITADMPQVLTYAFGHEINAYRTNTYASAFAEQIAQLQPALAA